MNLRIALLCAYLFSVAGCVAPRVTTFFLSAPVAPSASVSAALRSGDPRLHVRRVTVPEYLDNNNIMLRRGQTGVFVDSTARWLEPLSQGMTHALATGLTERLPQDWIITDGPVDSSDRLLSVNVETFDLWRNGRCILTASWTVVERDTGALLISGYGTFVAAPNKGSADTSDVALVGAVSDTVGRLIGKIAIATVMNEITAGVH